MNSDRIKEIQQKTAYPESISVKQALLQVWNECEQENEAVAFGDWLRRQRPDVFYGSPTTKQLFENFKNNNMTKKQVKSKNCNMPHFSINVTIDEDAGKVDIINNKDKTKYELEAYQPYGAALYQGRKIAEIMKCELTINNCTDDGRAAPCIIKKSIISLNGV
jgi:hypothetical protein